MYRKFKYRLILFTCFFALISSLGMVLNFNVCAAPTSSNSSSANKSSSKSSDTKSSQSLTKSKSNSKNKGTDSLLPDAGESIAPATSESWDDILSALEQDKDKDEFTFSENPNSGIFANKLAWTGFGLIAASVLGFTYFFFSHFANKKSSRESIKQNTHYGNIQNFKAQGSGNTNSVSPGQRDIKTRKTNPQTLYSDGYGHTRKPKTQMNTPLSSNYKNNSSQNKPKTDNRPQQHTEQKIKAARHMISDDSDNIFSFSNDSKNNYSTKTKQNEGKYSNSTKRDEFWNDFFSK